MNLTTQQMEALIERVEQKIYPTAKYTPNTLQWRGEKIIRRLVCLIIIKRIKEGRYYNGL